MIEDLNKSHLAENIDAPSIDQKFRILEFTVKPTVHGDAVIAELEGDRRVFLPSRISRNMLGNPLFIDRINEKQDVFIAFQGRDESRRNMALVNFSK